MRIFNCGCSLTRESWALCRAHYDAKEGRLDAYWNELERLEGENQRLRSALVAFVEDEPEPPRTCYCDDWMIVAPGTKCKYCNARAAISAATERAKDEGGSE